MKIKKNLAVALVMLGIDWALGVLQAAGIIPTWSFLVFNFPFGLPFVWIESQWAGTHYEWAGRSISEDWSFLAWFFAVGAQAWLYSWLWGFWQKRKLEKCPA